MGVGVGVGGHWGSVWGLGCAWGLGCGLVLVRRLGCWLCGGGGVVQRYASDVFRHELFCETQRGWVS